MAIPSKTRDPAPQINDYGRVAARVRVYDAQTGTEIRAPIGPIPARLRPETIKFLQRNDPPAKQKDSRAPRKVTNQLIPAPAVSPQHFHLPFAPSPSPPASQKNATNEQSTGTNLENPTAGDSFAEQAYPSTIQQPSRNGESPIEVAPLHHSQNVPHQSSFSGGENGRKVPSNEPKMEERLDTASNTGTFERDPITGELQDLIEQSLIEHLQPSTGSEGSAESGTRLGATEAFENTELPYKPRKAQLEPRRPASTPDTSPSNLENGFAIPNNECCCNKTSFGRFEIFLRERSRSKGRSGEMGDVGDIKDHGTDNIDGEPSRQDATPSELEQEPKQPANRHWRWWKLVLNEHVTQEPTDFSKAQDNEYGEAKVRPMHASGNEMHSAEVEATRYAEDQSLDQAGFGPTEQQSQFAGEETVILPCPQSLLQGNRVIRVEDVFGNGVLVDHDEIPLDALDSLCLLNTSECAKTIRRERRGQRLRQAARLQPIEPRNQLGFPRASIAPLLQNDGADSLHQHIRIDCTEGRNATQDLSNVPGITDGILVTSPGEDTGLAQADEKAVIGSKTKKIVISIEDGSKKLVHIEILPGKATAVVRNEASE